MSLRAFRTYLAETRDQSISLYAASTLFSVLVVKLARITFLRRLTIRTPLEVFIVIWEGWIKGTRV